MSARESQDLKELLTSIPGITVIEDIKFLIESPEEVELSELNTEVRLMVNAIKAGKKQEGVQN